MDPKTQAALDRLLALVTSSENFLRARTEANRPPVRQPVMLRQGAAPKGATLISELGVEGYLNSLKNRQHNIQPAVRLPPIAQHVRSLPPGTQTTIFDPGRGVAGKPLPPGPIEGPAPTPYAHKGYGSLRPGGPIVDPKGLWPASGVPPTVRGAAPPVPNPQFKNFSSQAFVPTQTDVALHGYRPTPAAAIPELAPAGRFGQAMAKLAPAARILQRSLPALGLAHPMPTLEGGRIVPPASDPLTDQAVDLLTKPRQTLSDVPRAWEEFFGGAKMGADILKSRLFPQHKLSEGLDPAMLARAAREKANRRPQPTPQHSVPPWWPGAQGGR